MGRHGGRPVRGIAWEFDTAEVEDGAEARLDLDAPALHVAGRGLRLPEPPDWLRQVWAEGGVVAYFRRHGRLPLGE